MTDIPLRDQVAECMRDAVVEANGVAPFRAAADALLAAFDIRPRSVARHLIDIEPNNESFVRPRSGWVPQPVNEETP